MLINYDWERIHIRCQGLEVYWIKNVGSHIQVYCPKKAGTGYPVKKNIARYVFQQILDILVEEFPDKLSVEDLLDIAEAKTWERPDKHWRKMRFVYEL